MPQALSPPPLGLWPALVHRQPDSCPVSRWCAQLRALPRRVRRTLTQQWRGPLVGMALVLALGQQPVRRRRSPSAPPVRWSMPSRRRTRTRRRAGVRQAVGRTRLCCRPGSTQTLTEVNNEHLWAHGLPVIRSVITIAGQGSTITRARRAPEFRLFAVNRTGELTLQETTVSGGRLVDGMAVAWRTTAAPSPSPTAPSPAIPLQSGGGGMLQRRRHLYRHQQYPLWQ